MLTNHIWETNERFVADVATKAAVSAEDNYEREGWGRGDQEEPSYALFSCHEGDFEEEFGSEDVIWDDE